MEQKHIFQEIIDLLYKAADQSNSMLPHDGKIEKIPTEILSGKGGKLDSLGLFVFLISVEELIQADLSVQISLSESVMTLDSAPLTIDRLAHIIASKVG